MHMQKYINLIFLRANKRQVKTKIAKEKKGNKTNHSTEVLIEN